MTNTEQRIPVAALVHESTDNADEVLLQFALSMKKTGLKVRGVAQFTVSRPPAGARDMSIIDISTGERLKISESRGKDARGCCLDSAALSDASIILRHACADQPDLTVVNRFGRMEAEGSGFADELLELMALGLPVLTVVDHKYLDAWREFTGGMATELEPDAGALRTWYTELPKTTTAPD
ncbi:DUF2478 domain-containing protein [Allopusillimonas ginsengisoli]|uniref:DUF2478 domain-containing protein n=1 Tax=Allopusillimonas ginsengisoli TaxID=453575 RepID=UPI0010C22512|nr:DUF2478 domain-containing protein [Allopusillimonas ginsengisoli]